MDGGWILAAYSFLKQEGAETEVIDDDDGADRAEGRIALIMHGRMAAMDCPMKLLSRLKSEICMQCS